MRSVVGWRVTPGHAAGQVHRAQQRPRCGRRQEEVVQQRAVGPARGGAVAVHQLFARPARPALWRCTLRPEPPKCVPGRPMGCPWDLDGMPSGPLWDSMGCCAERETSRQRDVPHTVGLRWDCDGMSGNGEWDGLIGTRFAWDEPWDDLGFGIWADLGWCWDKRGDGAGMRLLLLGTKAQKPRHV